MAIGSFVTRLLVALDARVRRHRVGGLLGNDDGDLSGAQQLAITAVGIAVIVGVVMPALQGGLGTVISNMLAKLNGI